jgi:L,D-peptidoglycan transpeptidase YkuD (ErfK/YbiS/YcfS/YnhG family)
MRRALLNSIARNLTFLIAAAAPALAQSDPQPLSNARQLIVVTTPDWNAVEGRLQRYQRSKPGQHWNAIGDPLTIVVGKKGTAWGRGILPPPGPISLQDPVKKEGDGKSPAGAFRLTSAFGYAPQPQPGWKMSYIPLTPTVECVDDSNSQYYNRIVDRSTIAAPDWHSSEHMASEGTAYVWGAVIDQNPTPSTAYGGSCVFLHVWAGRGQGTSGCTAMPQDQLRPILAWLDPAQQPILIQAPIASYKKLKEAWKLPNPPKT